MASAASACGHLESAAEEAWHEHAGRKHPIPKSKRRARVPTPRDRSPRLTNPNKALWEKGDFTRRVTTVWFGPQNRQVLRLSTRGDVTRRGENK